MTSKVEAKIVRDPAGVCRIFCQRAKFKWWFELGKHRETDKMFESALKSGTLHLRDEIEDGTKLF